MIFQQFIGMLNACDSIPYLTIGRYQRGPVIDGWSITDGVEHFRICAEPFDMRPSGAFFLETLYPKIVDGNLQITYSLPLPIPLNVSDAIVEDYKRLHEAKITMEHAVDPLYISLEESKEAYTTRLLRWQRVIIASQAQSLLKRLELGDPEALCVMATRLQKACEEPKVVVDLWKQAASSNYPPALGNLAWAYNNGYGVKQDKGLQTYYELKAAEHENIDAMKALYLRTLRKEENAVDAETARKFLQKCVDLGDMESLYNLGTAYMNGDLVEQDEAKGRVYLEQYFLAQIGLSARTIAIEQDS